VALLDVPREHASETIHRVPETEDSRELSIADILRGAGGVGRLPGVPADEANRENRNEHQVTPLELFFDLAMVFAFTQVTRLLVRDPTWNGVLRGGLILAALWWAWTVYAWFTSALDVDEGGVRLAMLTATGAMLFVALAVPGAFGEDGLLFACSYAVVRLLHITLSTIISRDDRRRFPPGGGLSRRGRRTPGHMDDRSRDRLSRSRRLRHGRRVARRR
jgi:hypothetical protein